MRRATLFDLEQGLDKWSTTQEGRLFIIFDLGEVIGGILLGFPG
jgi:hypothetical protein